jgi:hypothetical protein
VLESPAEPNPRRVTRYLELIRNLIPRKSFETPERYRTTNCITRLEHCIEKQASVEARRVVHRRLVAIGDCLLETKCGFDLPIDEPQESTEQAGRKVFNLRLANLDLRLCDPRNRSRGLFKQADGYGRIP